MEERFAGVCPPPSIYELVAAHLDPTGTLEEGELTLPDEEAAVAATDGLRFAAGAFEELLTGDEDSDEASAKAAAAAAAFADVCGQPTGERLHQLHAALSHLDVIDFARPMLYRLEQLGVDQRCLRDLARWLATRGDHRGPVKVGIAILGLTGDADDLDVLRTLAAHDEFTVWSASALTRLVPDPETELWALATRVQGWGRIQCVRLLRDTDDPQIREWILRGGFRNSIMVGYLAHVAATTGGLLAALRAEVVDRDLLTAAGRSSARWRVRMSPRPSTTTTTARRRSRRS